MTKEEKKIDWLMIIALVLAVIFVISSFYDFDNKYENVSEPTILINQIEEIQDKFSHTNELHWGHMPITYGYDTECKYTSTLIEGKSVRIIDEEFISRIESGLKFITEETNQAVRFIKVEEDENPDIFYVCNVGNKLERFTDYDYFRVPNHLLGEAHSFINENTSVYAPGYILMGGIDDLECSTNKPIIVIHETLHMLGIKHSTNIQDIMYAQYKKECSSDLSKEDINFLWDIYDPLGEYRPYGVDEYNCLEKYYSCRDFRTQHSAQKVLEYCGLDNDIHILDSDQDGLACENLP